MIEIKNVKKTYGSKDNPTIALNNVSLKINDGDFIVLLGASGSGKSTLLNVVSGLERPDSGIVEHDRKNITTLSDDDLTTFRRENVGFIFQQYYLLSNLNVDKNVKMGADLSNNKEYQKIIEAVGLVDKLDKFPSELSGGEQQRVSIARALAKKT
jgi:putative ABC transport system ATP-binding protein